MFLDNSAPFCKFIPLATDEIFVKLMDYKDAWLSNYGRVIRFSDGKYNLLQGNYDNYGALRYSLKKIFSFIFSHEVAISHFRVIVI